MSQAALDGTLLVVAAEPLADELDALLHISTTRCATTARHALAHSEDPHVQVVAGYYLASALRLSGSDDEALATCDTVDGLARDLSEPVWRARSLECRALVHHGSGDDETAVELLQDAVLVCRAAGDTLAQAEALTLLGRTFSTIPGMSARAAATLGTARRLWIAGRDQDGAVAAQVHLAVTYVATSREIAETNLAGARAAARRALAAAELAVREADAAGLAELSVQARLAVAEALVVAEAPADEIEHALDSTGALLERFPAPAQQLELHHHRATHLRRSGDLVGAVAEVRAGLALAQTRTRSRERELLLEQLGELLEAADDLPGAVQALREVNDALRARARLSAERRSTVISARLDAERARESADRERRRAAVLEERNAELAWAAEHDPLTGLPNRRALDAALSGLIGSDRTVSVCLVDVDHFKLVNDTTSHQVGDRVLVGLAQALRTAVRPTDLATRYGGEEFALLLPDADARAAAVVAERLRASVESLMWPFELPGGRVTVSVGVTTVAGPTSVAELLTVADKALYVAKGAGRNKVVAL